MFKFLRPDPGRKLEKKIAAKLALARDVQRSGDLKKYARLMQEIDVLQSELDRLD